MPRIKTAEKLEDLRAQLKELERQAAEEDAMPEERRLAEDMHEINCRYNHVDQCGWSYESWETGAMRKRYAIAAEAILTVTDVETASAVLQIARRAR